MNVFWWEYVYYNGQIQNYILNDLHYLKWQLFEKINLEKC